MSLRSGCVVCLLICLGCQSFVLSEGESEHGQSAAVVPTSASGQVTVRPIGYFEPILAAQPQLTRSHLSQATALLEKGDLALACGELAKYLRDHPEHFEVRIHRADLLWRQGRLDEASMEFVRSIAQAQEQGEKTLRQRVQCHSALMEIAEAEDDDYGLYLHRGVGIYLLALQRAKLPEPDGRLSVEGLLCRAASELTMARMYRPSEAQPCWYLHQVWSALGQQATAKRWLDRAMAAAPFAELTAAERRELELTASMAGKQPIRP